ncbi:MAG: RloB domain-containing protein [Parcubacteria group bacterium]
MKNKKQIRKAKYTILFFGEGLAEEVFLKYLRKAYAARNSGVAVKIRNGQGGSADGIVQRAGLHPGSFDRRVVVLDNDKPRAEMEKARKLAKDGDVSVIENNPCLEALLLRILSKVKFLENKDSKYYKKEFEKKYICKNKRCDIDEYEKIFPKNILDSSRKKIKELGEIIGFMENKK